MKICVYGLWHLGCVTAGCLASAGFQVTGLDWDDQLVESLRKGIPPLFEPGLEDLIQAEVGRGNLLFTNDPDLALRGVDIVWISFDTPVDEEDNADVDYVADRIASIFPFLPDEAAIIISSQVQVGFTRRMEKIFAEEFPNKPVVFVYSPENLRLGKALEAFRHPGRIVVGTRKDADKERVAPLFTKLCDSIEWMHTESAEMTKHAINSFLATSVVFANELAVLCERVGADAGEVARGMKSESRIGMGAYLSPGSAFGGGTLARDVSFLRVIGQEFGVSAILFNAVKESNDYHKSWSRRMLEEIFGELTGRKVAVLGLTYKPGTDTLRRSNAVELCEWLFQQGAMVRSYDPAVKSLPEELDSIVFNCNSVESAIEDADCLVVGTEWPAFKTIQADNILKNMREAIVIDASGFLKNLMNNRGIKYFSVGRGQIDEA